MRTPLRRRENPRPRHIPMIILYARRGIIKKARSPQRAPRFSDFSPRRAALERDGLSLCFSEIENHQEDSGNRGDARENEFPDHFERLSLVEQLVVEKLR